MRKKAKNFNNISTSSNIMFNIILAFSALLSLLPVALVVGTSFAEESYIERYGYKIFPKEVSFFAYEFVWKNSKEILNAYSITIIVTIIGVILGTLFMALYAYPLSRKNFKYRKLFTFYLFFTMLFTVGMVPWYLVCTKLLHIQDTIFALILPYLVSAWYIIISRTFISTAVPDTILESAKIDGANEFRIFFKIVMPIAVPGLATVALFSTLGYWNDWYLPLMLTTNPALSNLQYYLYRILINLRVLSDSSSAAYTQADIILQTLPKQSARMAICVIAMGPIVLAYPFFQRYFVQGLTIGAIKG